MTSILDTPKYLELIMNACMGCFSDVQSKVVFLPNMNFLFCSQDEFHDYRKRMTFCLSYGIGTDNHKLKDLIVKR